MKKTFKALNFIGVILFLTVSFMACDKDFSTIESDVLGEGNINFNTDKINLPIVAYNKKLDSLQINNLPSELLGFYDDEVFGQTTASIVTQIAPTGYGPNFGTNPSMDSVVLSIPYYSRILTDSTYTIQDSLYAKDSLRLSIYRNNYFLRDFDPTSANNTQQNYYSKADGSISGTDNLAMTNNTIINFDANKGELLKDTIFIPSNKAILTVTYDEDGKKTTTRSVPAFRTKLDTTYWKTIIFDKQGQPELSNENNFKNYFRGLYFKAEAVNGKGSLVLLNMASTDAKITIYYSYDNTGTAGTRTQSSYNLNFSSASGININRVNTFTNNYSIPLADGNKTLGDDKLYLKGTEGSMAVVDLFCSGMVQCENPDGSTSLVTALECFKRTYRMSDGNGGYKRDPFTGNYILKQLINEARLVIHEDETMNIPTPDYHKYDRIYAYDVKNNRPTEDYLSDPTSNSSKPISSKILSLGQRDPNQKTYKIRLTEHLNNILIKDSTNTKIGLVLSSNVNLINNSKILSNNDNVTGVPSVSIITPRGTVLYGTNSNIPESKKMKLEIFFTKPK